MAGHGRRLIGYAFGVLLLAVPCKTTEGDVVTAAGKDELVFISAVKERNTDKGLHEKIINGIKVGSLAEAGTS